MLFQEQGAALVCADSPARHPAGAWLRMVDRLEDVSRIGGPIVGWQLAPCASWPTASADRYTGPWNATTRNPILVIGTRFDPNTPLRNARLAARRLGNAVLLVHDGYGHTSHRDPSTCVIQATSRYLVDLTTPPPHHPGPSARRTVSPSTLTSANSSPDRTPGGLRGHGLAPASPGGCWPWPTATWHNWTRSGPRLLAAWRSPSNRHMSATAPAPATGCVSAERDTVVRVSLVGCIWQFTPGVCAAAPVTGCRSSE
jgi:TAP-like protein